MIIYSGSIKSRALGTSKETNKEGDRMPRRKVHVGEHYEFDDVGYLINVRDDSGVYVNIMDSICQQLVCAYSKGRWSLVHIRYVLEDGATNRMVLDQVKLKFKKNARCLWVLEESKQEDAQFHYHMMLLVNEREVNMTKVRYALYEIKKKGILHSYRRIPPDPTKISDDLRQSLDVGELKESITKYGLDITNRSALRYGVYWMSYLAKVSTKPMGPQRNYDQTRVPNSWRESTLRDLTLI